jgi:hypothetical protein
MENFRKSLVELLNKNSKENDSNTPDFILAEYLMLCLEAYNKTLQVRESWYGRDIEQKNPEEKILCEPDTENFANNIIKTAENYHYNCLCARATLYPGKTISEVEEILKYHTAEYLLDTNYSNLTSTFRESVRRIIRGKTGTIPDSEKCTNFMFLPNNTMVLNGKKYKLIPCENVDDWEITRVLANGCPCGHNGKTMPRENSTIQVVRVGKKNFEVGQTLINGGRIERFTLQNNRVYAAVRHVGYPHISICEDFIDIVELYNQ